MTDNRPVAEYLRMSTEHQQYSLDNQHMTIAAYAEKKASPSSRHTPMEQEVASS
jgi:DNA invertase Pin-like site-specific DNA recombinase